MTSRFFKTILVLFALPMISAACLAQITLSSLTANNTSACPGTGALPSHCSGYYAGERDGRPGVTTPLFSQPAGHVSEEDMHPYLSHGAKTRIFANLMTGFCIDPKAKTCHENVQVGYDSEDPKTIAAQVAALRRRHIDGAILDWNGPGHDKNTLEFQSYLDQHDCEGPQQCVVSYLEMEDEGSTNWNQFSTGIPGTSGAGCHGLTGELYATCLVAHIRNDMCYMNGNHWGNEAYEKSNGQPIVLVFEYESIIPESGSAVSWKGVWSQIDEWDKHLSTNCQSPPYNADNGKPLLIFEGAGGFTHAATSGSFYWVTPAGSDPATDQRIDSISPESEARTLDHFLRTGLNSPGEQVWGVAFKGFNSSHAVWGPNRIVDQRCGLTWLGSLTEGNRYFTKEPLPFLQIATWNDYNEGTDIEAGIDNCYIVEASATTQELRWSLVPSNPNANLATVSHLEIYDAADDQHLTLLARMPASTSGSCSLASLSAGKHTLYVYMVGRNSILNRISAAVPYSR